MKTFPEKYGRLPHLVVVLVGEDAGSVSYVTGKTKAADEVGILNTTIRKPADISEEELLKIIDDLNADDTVDGIFNGCITKQQSVVRIVLIGKFRGSLQSGIETHIDFRTALSTTFRSYKNYTIGTLHTVNGSCGCIFQN